MWHCSIPEFINDVLASPQRLLLGLRRGRGRGGLGGLPHVLCGLRLHRQGDLASSSTSDKDDLKVKLEVVPRGRGRRGRRGERGRGERERRRRQEGQIEVEEAPFVTEKDKVSDFPHNTM